MLDWLQSIYDAITHLTDYFDLFGDWLYSLLAEFLSRLIIGSTIAGVKFTMWMAQLSYDTAIQIMHDLHFSDQMNLLYSQIPDDARNFLTFMEFPQMFNMLASAAVTRFVMGKLGVLT